MLRNQNGILDNRIHPTQRVNRNHKAQEHALCQDTEKCLDHERATVRVLSGFLNKLRVTYTGSPSIILPESAGLGTVLHEWTIMGVDLESKRNELETLRAEIKVLKEEVERTSNAQAPKRFKLDARSRSETLYYSSDEEIEPGSASWQPSPFNLGKRKRGRWA